MLNKRETIVMEMIYETCIAKDTVLLTFKSLFERLPKKSEFREDEFDGILKSLELDGYIDTIITEKNQEKFIVVTMHEKGKAFTRERLHQKRQIQFKIIMTVAGAIGAFIIGQILLAIF